MNESPCRWCREGMRLIHSAYFAAVFSQMRLPVHARGEEFNHQEIRICNDPVNCIVAGWQHTFTPLEHQGEIVECCIACFKMRRLDGSYVEYPR